MTPHTSSYAVALPFGKFKGKTLGEIAGFSRQYLEWLSGADGVSDTWRIAAAKTLLGEPVPYVAPAEKTDKSKLAIPKIGEIKIFPVTARRFGIMFPYHPLKVEQFKASIDGLAYDEENNWWTFPKPQIVRVVKWWGGPSKCAVDAKVRDAYFAEKTRTQTLQEIASRLESDLVVKTKIPLRGDQLVAIEYAEAAGGSILEADDTGNGKTFTSVGWAEYNGGKTLIVVKNGLQAQWAEEVKRLTGKKVCIWNAEGIQGSKASQYHLVHFNVVDRYIADYNKMKFDNLIVDEATMITNYKAIRTKAIMGAWKERKKYPGLKINNKMLLTASPIKNKSRELYTLLSFLDKDRFNNPKHFVERYEDIPMNMTTNPNLNELWERANELMIRRPKSILKGKKPQFIDLIVEMTDDERRQYYQFMTRMVRKWHSVNPNASSVHEVRRFLFDLKWERTTTLIDELLEEGRPVLSFCVQKEHTERLAKHYGSIARFVHGDVKTAERDQIKKDLMSGRLKLGSYTLETGGMGLDGLQTVISDTIFPERSFVPVDHVQAHGRTARPGQKSVPQMWYLTVQGTYEDIMKEIITDKTAQADQALDGKTLAESLVNQKMQESFFHEFTLLVAKQLDEAGIDTD